MGIHCVMVAKYAQREKTVVRCLLSCRAIRKLDYDFLKKKRYSGSCLCW